MSLLARTNPDKPELWTRNRDEAFQAYAETEGFPRCTRCGCFFDPDAATEEQLALVICDGCQTDG